jgi:glycosidase
MIKRFAQIITACLLTLLSAVFFFAQAPMVEKIEPPNWWAGMTINPVRILIRGKDLQGTRILTKQGSGLKAANFKTSENGHYLFFDLTVAAEARPGKYKLIAVNQKSSTNFEFEISEKLGRAGRFQGYSPDDVIYFLMPDRFADGDPGNDDPEKSKGLYDRSKGRFYHGGDLQGVIDKLPYIKSMGVTAIWTTPFYDNNDKPDLKEVYSNEKGVMQPTTGYHGYGAVNMYSVDEHLGAMAKLRELVEKAHALGIKIIQDQVANHTGPYHVWADDPPTPTWWNGTLKDHLSNNWQKWTTMNPRASYQTQKRNIEGWFIDILPDFNQGDPEVEKYLIQNSIWWMEMNGFDAIRMDTLPHVPRSFWQKWGSAVKREYPKVNILGELYDGDPALLAYFQTGRKGLDGIDTKIDTLYDYALFYPIRNAFARGGSIRGISNMFAHDWLYPNASVLTTFIGLHDMERFMSEDGATTDGLKLAQTLIMTSRGTPLLYYGDEIAMRGGGDPDNRRDFPGGFAGDGRNAFTPGGRNAEENDVWDHLALLGKLRRELISLREGKTLDLFDEDQQMAYARYTGTNSNPVIVIFNNDTKAVAVEFGIDKLQLANGQTLTDRLGKISDVKVENGRIRLTMPARTASILTAK